jgi:hypothetical protein
MDLAIRYLLHGQPDKYNSEEKLFIISRSDSLWSKLAHKVLEITNESWRLIDSSLSESISEEKFEQIGITRLIPSEVIELLLKKLDYIEEIFAQISSSDNEKQEIYNKRQDILNEIAKNIDNKELWRLLPLHKSSENEFVNIKENTYLQNPDPKLKKLEHKLLKVLKVTLINENINILHYPKEGWISQWSASAAMRILLEQPEPHNYTELILDVLQLFPDVKNEYRDKLKNTRWLRLSGGDAIAPVNILTYPEYLTDFSKKLGSELGEQLCQLFALTQNNWNEFIEALQITGTTQYEFWELIWNELAINSLDNQAKLIRVMMLGNKGMGYFLSNCRALPNGLWGEYQQLVLPSEIIYIVKNILKHQRFFDHVFQWERVRNRCNPSTIIHGNEWGKYTEIVKCSPVQQQFRTEDLNLLQVIKWQLLENPQADIQIANQVGELINKPCLEEIKQHGLSEYQGLLDWLNKVKFLSQSNNYQPNSKLLDINSPDDEERLQSAFAPDEYVLNQQYGNTGKDFFYACRSNRIDRKEEERLFEWIKNTAENKRSAAIEYLEYLKIVDDSLFSRLLPKLEQVDWLQEFFPKPKSEPELEPESEPEDKPIDKTGKDGTGDPGWGEPGEALAELFYKDFCQKNPGYSLEQRGGRGYNHDFLLCTHSREIKIEVKTIASKSFKFKLTISEWNELTSRDENYELFVVEHSGSTVTRVIRIQNVWDTLQKALANLKANEDITSESPNIESLIGLQKDNSKNVVILNWDKLIHIYGKRSNDENITFYRCNAKLDYGQRSVNPSNPTFVYEDHPS